MGNSCGSGRRNGCFVALDFGKDGSCKVSEIDSVIWTRVNALLQYTPQVLQQLQVYQGAVVEIKNAISNPDVEDHQKKAWVTVLPLVVQLKSYYDFSFTLGETFVELLKAVSSPASSPVNESLLSHICLVRHMASVLDFALKFDDLKMTNAAIQNDFSYYRRTLSRLQLTSMSSTEPIVPEQNVEVDCDTASQMALFYAHPMPMVKAVIEATNSYASADDNRHFVRVCDLLAGLISGCLFTLTNKKLRKKSSMSDEPAIMCLRVMVALVVIYDHVDPNGAFVSSSPVAVRRCINVVKQRAAGQTECLLNILRYSTKHLNSPSTPKAVRRLLATH